MKIYRIISKVYDLLDAAYFNDVGKNPRKLIQNMIPDSGANILDMCCGTLSNTIPIAKEKTSVKVVGLDLSKDMLQVAKEKINREHLKNVSLKCADAIKTGMGDQSFDYVIIGLVLHECSFELINGMLSEAYRLLKGTGHLIVLEWEPPKRLLQKVKFFPLYLGERINCKTFKQFYKSDKELFFRKYGFLTEQKVYCNYSVLLQMKKEK